MTVNAHETATMVQSTQRVEFRIRSMVIFRLAYFPPDRPVMVDMMAASPDGNGFNATFTDFRVLHLPDTQRLKWLANH